MILILLLFHSICRVLAACCLVSTNALPALNERNPYLYMNSCKTMAKKRMGTSSINSTLPNSFRCKSSFKGCSCTMSDQQKEEKKNKVVQLHHFDNSMHSTIVARFPAESTHQSHLRLSFIHYLCTTPLCLPSEVLL